MKVTRDYKDGGVATGALLIQIYLEKKKKKEITQGGGIYFNSSKPQNYRNKSGEKDEGLLKAHIRVTHPHK